MDYTISVAWVVSVDDSEIEAAPQGAFHRDVVQHAAATAELMRAKHPDTVFQCKLADMIISTPEVELAPKR